MPKIKIESDGDHKGTKISVDGKPIDNVHQVHFSHYDMHKDKGPLTMDGPSFEYHTEENDGQGIKRQIRHVLTKAGLQIMPIEAKAEPKNKVSDKPGVLNYKKKDGKEKNIYAHPGKKSPELIQKKTSAMIKKVGKQYCVYRSDGKTKIACHSTRQDAVRQLQAIEISKHKRGK